MALQTVSNAPRVMKNKDVGAADEGLLRIGGISGLLRVGTREKRGAIGYVPPGSSGILEPSCPVKRARKVLLATPTAERTLAGTHFISQQKVSSKLNAGVRDGTLRSCSRR
jgi:hypothetical protein